MINQDKDLSLEDLLDDEDFLSEEEDGEKDKRPRKKISVRDREYKVYYKLLNYILIKNSDHYVRRMHKQAIEQKMRAKNKPIMKHDNFFERMEKDIRHRVRKEEILTKSFLVQPMDTQALMSSTT